MHVATLGPGFGLRKMARVMREGDFPEVGYDNCRLGSGVIHIQHLFSTSFFLVAGRQFLLHRGFWGRYCRIWGGGSTDCPPGRPVPGGVEWSHCNLITESNETLGLKIWALGGDPWTEKVNFRETQQAEIFDVKDSHW